MVCSLAHECAVLHRVCNLSRDVHAGEKHLEQGVIGCAPFNKERNHCVKRCGVEMAQAMSKLIEGAARIEGSARDRAGRGLGGGGSVSPILDFRWCNEHS